jgi:hypothetical protein
MVALSQSMNELTIDFFNAQVYAWLCSGEAESTMWCHNLVSLHGLDFSLIHPRTELTGLFSPNQNTVDPLVSQLSPL